VAASLTVAEVESQEGLKRWSAYSPPPRLPRQSGRISRRVETKHQRQRLDELRHHGGGISRRVETHAA